MHTQEEIREDIDKVRSLIDVLKLKYGEEFSCVFAAGVGVNSEITSEPDVYSGGACMVGNSMMFHQACHCLLHSVKFIDGIIDAIKCTLEEEHRRTNKPEILGIMMITAMDSLKKLLVMSTDEFKEEVQNKEINDAVQHLLRDAGFEN